MATVNRVARRSLDLRRKARKVMRIRADKQAEIRRKVNWSIGKDRSRGGFHTNTMTETSVVCFFILANYFI